MFPRQTSSRPSFSSTRHCGAWWGRNNILTRFFGHHNAVEMRLPEGQRSSEWVVWLPAVVSSLNVEVTRSRAKTRCGHQRKGRLFQALHPSSQIFSPVRESPGSCAFRSFLQARNSFAMAGNKTSSRESHDSQRWRVSVSIWISS